MKSKTIYNRIQKTLRFGRDGFPPKSVGWEMFATAITDLAILFGRIDKE